MHTAKQIIYRPEARGSPNLNWPGWLPLAMMPVIALFIGIRLAPWSLMWLLAFALFLGCKWLTWWQNKNVATATGRQLAYLFLWPGMDARAFLTPAGKVAKPSVFEWTFTLLKIASGIVLVWVIAPRVIPVRPLLGGWLGLIGLVLLFHFGTLHFLALIWQWGGIDAQPLMRSPAKSTSLAEFWGLRWNSAFNRLVHNWLFRPLFRTVGTVAATMAVFLASGLIHELVISLPARGGYGLPTIYFLIQGVGLLFERTAPAKSIGLGHGVVGWAFTMLITADPVCWLFHPAFITRVIVPFLHVLNPN